MRIAARLAALSAGLALGACGSLPDVDSFRAFDTTTLFRPYSVTSFRDKPLAPITADDLVDSGGSCAGAVAAAGAGEAPMSEGGVPAGPSSIALEMTECEVVRRIGVPQQVDIGGASGEREYAVPPLALPAARRQASPEGLSQYPAVALFLERAIAIRSDFAVTSENAAAVAEICIRLDGLPLAIELAAVRTRVLSVEQILHRLNDRFGLLTGGGRGAQGTPVPGSFTILVIGK